MKHVYIGTSGWSYKGWQETLMKMVGEEAQEAFAEAA